MPITIAGVLVNISAAGNRYLL